MFLFQEKKSVKFLTQPEVIHRLNLCRQARERISAVPSIGSIVAEDFKLGGNPDATKKFKFKATSSYIDFQQVK